MGASTYLLGDTIQAVIDVEEEGQKSVDEAAGAFWNSRGGTFPGCTSTELSGWELFFTPSPGCPQKTEPPDTR